MIPDAAVQLAGHTLHRNNTATVTPVSAEAEDFAFTSIMTGARQSRIIDKHCSPNIEALSSNAQTILPAESANSSGFHGYLHST